MVLVAGTFTFAGCGGGEDQTQDLAEKAEETAGEVEEAVEGAKEDLAEILVELIRTNGKVVSAIYDCVCRCPNLVVEY